MHVKVDSTTGQSQQQSDRDVHQMQVSAEVQPVYEDARPEFAQLKAAQANMAASSHNQHLLTLQAAMASGTAHSQQANTNFPKKNNSGLPTQLKAGIENLSGMNMDHVKVHYNSDKPAQLQAHAYAQGGDIHIAPGQEQHLPHEAWHVVQQAQGRVKPTLQMKGDVLVNDDAGLESEADEMGAKAMSVGETTPPINPSNKVASPTGAVTQQRSQSHSIVQREVREKGDLDYGSSGPRAVGIKHARDTGQDKRGDIMPTVDNLNEKAHITRRMNEFKFHEMIDLISAFDKTTDDVAEPQMKHVYAWILYLKANIEKVNLKKQVDSAIGPTPADATKDRLTKNREGTAPAKESIRAWYYDKTMPADADELERLKGWVWNAFFRRTSKLGIDFTASLGKAIHFNISKDMYTRAMDQRDPGTAHKKLSITGSELRHLRKLQDRGLAPKVHFEANEGGVKNVDSPFKRLDLLSPAAKAKLVQRPEWKQHAVNFETRLGAYAANLPAAKAAVQAGLTKMDKVFASHHDDPEEAGEIAEYRKIFGKTKPTSSGQVGTDPATVASVITGKPILGQDPINLREQMTAYYNAAFWSSGTTIKKILTDLAKSPTAVDDAFWLDIGEEEIKKVRAVMIPQIKATQKILFDTLNLPDEQQLAKLQKDLELDLIKATELLQKIKDVAARQEEIENLPQEEKEAATNELKTTANQISVAHTKFNILVTSIDTDASRDARKTRPVDEREAVRKSAKDYADMGVPLSSREKAAAGGVPDNLAKLPWVDGIVYYRIDESQGWGKEMKEKGFPTVAGNSGTAARMLKVYQWLGGADALNFRMAIMGWMLPVRDHSLYEILEGAKSVGVTGDGEDLTNSIAMYKLIQPLNEATLKSNVAVDGLFPEEQVLKTVDIAVYKDLIQTRA